MIGVLTHQSKFTFAIFDSKGILMHNEIKSLDVTSLSNITKFILILVLVGLVSSCGKKHGDDKVSQSVVRVNGDEITVHQINNELSRANVQSSQQELAGKKIAQALVDRQILVQEAHKTKLDQNPRVMQVIESSKAQILAQAYLENKVSSIAIPSGAEVSDYRLKHVDIFANRKIYITDELSFTVDVMNSAELQSLSTTAKSLKDVTKWLELHQVKYAATRVAHAAETLPPPMLAKISKMSIGALMFINANGQTLTASLSEIKDVPISDKDSKPLIERIILEQKRKQAIDLEMKRLRGAAKIEYINKKFDPSTAATVNKSNTALKPGDSKEPLVSHKVESSIAKGLSGL